MIKEFAKFGSKSRYNKVDMVRLKYMGETSKNHNKVWSVKYNYDENNFEYVVNNRYGLSLNVMEDDIERKLTDEEIKQIELKKETDKYNL